MALIKTFLAMGIAILFTVFIAYGLYVVYEPPQERYAINNCSNDFQCYDLFRDKCTQDPIVDENNISVPRKYDFACENQVRNSAAYRECINANDACLREAKLQSPMFNYSRNSFWILLVIAAGSITAGILLSSLEGIGSGFVGGGILLVLWTLSYTYLYWLEFGKFIKLGAIGALLVLLVWLGYKKLDKK